MSWQAYVDTNLVGTKKVSKAAILGLKGGVWAATTGFTIDSAEQKAIVTSFSNLDNVRATGIRLAGQKYFVLRAEDQFIYGKKQEDGCVIVKTKQAILVAQYESPIQQAECTTVVHSLGDYLSGLGY